MLYPFRTIDLGLIKPSAGPFFDFCSAGRGVTLGNGGVGSVEGSVFSLLNVGYGEVRKGDPIIRRAVMVNLSRK
jgi:hypothetical protein